MKKATISWKTSMYADFLNAYQPLEVCTNNLSPDNVGLDIKWTMSFVPLELRVSLNFARICKQLFKA